jgi:hypothetical protein
MNTNLDEHMDEYKQEKAKREAEAKAAEEQKEAIERLAYQAKQATERNARIAKQLPHLRKIALRMKNAQVDEQQAKIIARGIDLGWQVTWQDRYSSDRFRPKLISQQIRIGEYGDRSLFPQKQDGTFNYDKIAERLDSIVDRTLLKQKLDNQKEANEGAAERVRQALEIYRTWHVTPSQNADNPVFVNVEVKRALTEQDAIKLLKALREAGVDIS